MSSLPHDLMPVVGGWMEKQLNYAENEVSAWPAGMRGDRNCPCTRAMHVFADLHGWEDEIKSKISSLKLH